MELIDMSGAGLRLFFLLIVAVLNLIYCILSASLPTLDGPPDSNVQWKWSISV